MYQIVLFIHVIIDIALVVLILIQQGKGATMGAAFGSGASNTVFGSQGSGSFLLKLTGALGAGFFASCIVLGYLAATEAQGGKHFSVSQPQQPVPVQQPVKK